jgi:hypothetical protein
MADYSPEAHRDNNEVNQLSSETQETIKVASRIVEYSHDILCCGCKQKYPTKQFVDHLDHCSQKNSHIDRDKNIRNSLGSVLREGLRDHQENDHPQFMRNDYLKDYYIDNPINHNMRGHIAQKSIASSL